ncbi:TetR/AcrR family transcriptional regulator [Leeia sp.]|uniref:TetR/AcrR family transcriptional regulator n=1 Tax=Leeia sp. TaxID=2884678 RepID=UPI0035B08433
MATTILVNQPVYPAMARPSNTETRRSEIVQALLTVMARHGYEKATIQLIAREARLSPGLLHYHFKHKQEILVALVEALADYAEHRFARLCDGQSQPRQQLEAYLHAWLSLGEGASPERVAAWVMIGAEAVRQPEVRTVYQRVIEAELSRLRGLIQQVQPHKPEPFASTLAASLLAMITGSAQLACATRDIMPSAYAAQAAIDYLRQALA